MAIKKMLALFLTLGTLVILVLSVKNVSRAHKARSGIEVNNTPPVGIDLPSIGDLNDLSTSLKESIEGQQSRYYDNPKHVFYQFAENLASLAATEGLSVIKASETGRTINPFWEMRMKGNPGAVSSFLKMLDEQNYYIEYQNLSIKKLPNEELEMYLVLHLPDRPEIVASQQTVLEEPVEIVRVHAQEVARLFGSMSSAGGNSSSFLTAESTREIQQSSDVLHIELVGRFIDSEGNPIFAFKDMNTGRVRQLSIGASNLGWTLVSVESRLATLLIGEHQYFVPMED